MAAAMPIHPEIVSKKMFGCPAAFVHEYAFVCTYGEGIVVKLADADCAGLAAEGGRAFEPMPGRPMRGWVVLPAEHHGDPVQLSEWVARAFEHVAALPPKRSGKKR
jgi:hypothetical protein